MLFFTDLSTHASHFCLLKVSDYYKPLKFTKTLCFVDPGVIYLEKRTEYPHLNKLHYLAKNHLLPNEYISIDYPIGILNPDNFQYQTLVQQFITKTYQNNLKYQDNLHYICTPQYKFMDFNSFKDQLNQVRSIYAGKQKIVGIGNIRSIILPCKFLNQVFEYLVKNHTDFYWIHFYGMSSPCIKEYLPKLEYVGLKVSADSTKWTRLGSSKKLYRKYFRHPDQSQLLPTSYDQPGISCNNETRDEFFLEYMENFKKAGLSVQY